jgi:hypothetical protein
MIVWGAQCAVQAGQCTRGTTMHDRDDTISHSEVCHIYRRSGVQDFFAIKNVSATSESPMPCFVNQHDPTQHHLMVAHSAQPHAQAVCHIVPTVVYGSIGSGSNTGGVCIYTMILRSAR